MINIFQIKRCIKFRNLLIFSLILLYVTTIILTIVFEKTRFLDVIMSIYVVVCFLCINVIGLIWNKCMNNCSCPHCQAGRKFRNDVYYSRLFESYNEGTTSFICPICQGVIEIVDTKDS